MAAKPSTMSTPITTMAILMPFIRRELVTGSSTERFSALALTGLALADMTAADSLTSNGRASTDVAAPVKGTRAENAVPIFGQTFEPGFSGRGFGMLIPHDGSHHDMAQPVAGKKTPS